MPAPFEPIQIQLNSARIDADTSCPPLKSIKTAEAKLWKMIQTLYAEDFIYLPCHNMSGIDWPDRKKVK